MDNKLSANVALDASVGRLSAAAEALGLHQIYEIECRRRDGSLKWREEVRNLVTDEGLNDWLNKYWNGNLYSAAHYVGLTDGTPTVDAGDTMGSHGGWAEVTAYAESVRQQLNMGTAASKAIDNSANKAVVTSNANATVVGGVFISTNSTKGGTAGLCIAAGAFSGGDKTVDNGESLSLTVTSSIASL